MWYFPLILSTDYTNIPLLIFLPLFMIGILFLVIIFGQMRQASESVWPPVQLHGMGKALGYALLGGNFLTYNNELLSFIGPGVQTITLMYGLIALLLWRHRLVEYSQT